MMEMLEVEPFSFFYEEDAAAAGPPPLIDELTHLSEMMFPWAEDLRWWEPTPPPPVVQRSSAFKRYESEGRCCGGSGGGRMNVHRRIVEYLRRMPVQKVEKIEMVYSRSMKHMIRERQRRERLGKSYADLHRMISPQPKVDKSSIVLAAAAYLRSLRSTRDALQRRHQELRAAAQIGGAGIAERGATIKLRVGNPSSPVDSMIASLQRLKSLGVKARSIRSGAGDRELSAAIDVETEMSTDEVERAVQRALVEVEWKLRNCPRSTPPASFQTGPT